MSRGNRRRAADEQSAGRKRRALARTADEQVKRADELVAQLTKETTGLRLMKTWRPQVKEAVDLLSTEIAALTKATKTASAVLSRCQERAYVPCLEDVGSVRSLATLVDRETHLFLVVVKVSMQEAYYGRRIPQPIDQRCLDLCQRTIGLLSNPDLQQRELAALKELIRGLYSFLALSSTGQFLRGTIGFTPHQLPECLGGKEPELDRYVAAGFKSDDLTRVLRRLDQCLMRSHSE